MTKFIINQEDKYRVLATELTPFETPLIFSNQGFYENIKRDDLPEELKILINSRSRKKPVHSIPYTYKIDKGDNSSRHLSLIHPSQQLEACEFYKSCESRILYHCSKSDFSLRRPSKKASMFYTKKTIKTEEKVKSEESNNANNDHETPYQNSYFSYEKYQHINGFTSSIEFLEYEENYKYLLKLDIQSCFDSLYTHAICWSIKDKEFSKNNSRKNNFENNFDSLMQRSNYNETNGIIVGPEISRIFNEIILQKIDNEIKAVLTKKSIFFESNYIIKRYVDDFFIFSNSREILQKIESTVESILFKYKLSLNKHKTNFSERPFFTPKDIAIDKIRKVIKSTHNSLTNLEKHENFTLRLPKERIKDRNFLVSKTIREIKSIIKEEKIKINDVTPYICKALRNIIFEFIDKSQNFKISIDEGNFDFLAFYFDMLLYFYSLDRRTSSSFSFCYTTLTLHDYIKELKSPYFMYFYDKLSHYFQKKIITSSEREFNENETIEILNIMLSTQYISHILEGKLQSKIIEEIYHKIPESYFKFITFAFIFSWSSQYHREMKKLSEEFKTWIINNIRESGLSKSETVHAILDLLSCKKISKEHKHEVLMVVIENEDFKKTQSTFNYATPKTNSSKLIIFDKIIQFCETQNWFTNWDEINIRKVLMKKELNPTY
ncbi:antiviral reverse transcriptase Drt3b [Shewanella algae]|uniref:antiviral reverse transcriptase Drt3b n=1 Tax=Shewanella algae TaxID=38313 RepID=UPI000B8A74A7|nr:antiviral reverse transcriptase Drt3b [Shewanella algae]